MFGLGIGEILVILVVALLVLGPQKLPEAARALGKGIRELRKGTLELREAFDAEMRETKQDIDVEGVKRAFGVGTYPSKDGASKAGASKTEKDDAPPRDPGRGVETETTKRRLAEARQNPVLPSSAVKAGAVETIAKTPPDKDPGETAS